MLPHFAAVSQLWHQLGVFLGSGLFDFLFLMVGSKAADKYIDKKSLKVYLQRVTLSNLLHIYIGYHSDTRTTTLKS